MQTPYHAYSSMSVNGQSFKSEVIFVAGTEYSLSQGTWMVYSTSAGDRQNDAAHKPAAIATTNCQHLRDEPVDGEATGVYRSHSPGGDQTIWISKSKGVVLRSELDVGHGPVTTHMWIRYEYSHVQKPKS